MVQSLCCHQKGVQSEEEHTSQTSQQRVSKGEGAKMPSFHPSGSLAASGLITVEGSTLPVIRAAGFEVRVNAYVVGRTRRVATSPSVATSNLRSNGSDSAGPSTAADDRDRSPGCQGGVTDLWYLSLVGAHGQGTSLRALWANLVSNHNRAVWLEGIGSVTLGHNRLDLGGLGYPIHWSYRQTVLPPSRDVHGVLESDLLTCYDPLLAPASSRRSPRRNIDTRAATTHEHVTSVSHDNAGAGTANGKGVGSASTANVNGKKSQEGTVVLSTRSGASEERQVVTSREAHPLFLLLVRGQDEASLPRLHLRYLATRIPWLPYYPAWADYLWQRGRERKEIEGMHVWCYRNPVSDGSSQMSNTSGTVNDKARCDAASGSVPYVVAAFLCRPDPLALTAELSRAVASGVFRRAPQRGDKSRAGERAA